MLIKNIDHTISFSLFAEFPKVVCFISTRIAGNLHIRSSINTHIEQFLYLHKIAPSQCVVMQQIHGDSVFKVPISDRYTSVRSTDGLILDHPGRFLMVNVADCVPLFFYDPVKRVIGVAHAGWKGTVQQIAKNVIEAFKKHGSDAKDICVAIGPHIGGCCYSVDKERAQLFLKECKNDTVVFESEGVWKIDLGMANKLQLVRAGVLDTHIDAPIICTSCQNDQYFSFRKDGKIEGEMLGVIGIKK